MKTLLLGIAAVALLSSPVYADTIVIGGSITQSTGDGTGPAENNPSLNNIQDGDPFLLALHLPSSITGPGLYDLTGTSLTFSDPLASATETAFGSISLSISVSSGVDQISLFACLTSGSGCNFGNQLSASFSIPSSQLNSTNVGAAGLDEPHPLDLLEDDGVTDIQGATAQYSYTSAVPLPDTLSLLLCGLAGLFAALRLQHTKGDLR
jgi:hypothetical protein